MANDLTFDQIAATLNSINEQVTGETSIAPADTSEFITVGQKLLKMGYDPVMGALSQVEHKTIYSARNYDEKIDFLRVSNERYGNHVRKVNYRDKALSEDVRYSLEDGQTVDQYVVNKPSVVQTNFYGVETYEKMTTIFTDQLDSALTNPDEFGSFLTGQLSNIDNQLKMTRDTTARMIIANYMAGKIKKDTNNVIHLVTEFNDEVDGSYTSETIMGDDIFPAFVKWLYARIQTISDLMTERSYIYHINQDGEDPIPRHSNYENQRITLLGGMMNKITTQVLSSVFHDDKLKMAKVNKVNFWQSIKTPGSINLSDANVMDPETFNVVKTGAVSQANILGLIYDEEAMGFTIVNERTTVTPFNAKGCFYNQYWKGAYRYWNDFTENGVVLVLD